MPQRALSCRPGAPAAKACARNEWHSAPFACSRFTRLGSQPTPISARIQHGGPELVAQKLQSSVRQSQRWRSRHLSPLPSQRFINAATAPAATEAAATQEAEPRSDSDTSAAADEPVDVHSILSDPDIEGDPLQFLKVSEAYWKALRNQRHNPGKRGPTVVSRRHRSVGPTDYDVCVAGGTLGVFLALTLQMQGHKVCIVERRAVEGRTQEWNISRAELGVLSKLGLLAPAEVEACIVSEWNPVRVGFKGSEDLWVRDVLNIGVDPRYLIQRLRERFLAAGGTIFERSTLTAAETAPDGIIVRFAGSGAASPATVGDTNRPSACRPEDLSAADSNGVTGNGSTAQPVPSSNGSKPATNGSSPEQHSSSSSSGGSSGSGKRKGGKQELRARLLVDCMGHYSPIVKQIRGGSKPEAMVLVVGGCADGVPAEQNMNSDLLYTFSDAEADMQQFWEAFPAAGGGRTTYMFTYADADQRRPSFEELLRRYFEHLPQYQGVPLAQLKFRRLLFGGFPCYRDSPLQTEFDRVLQVGDAAAAQSPLSFGGFGAMLRHLPRLSTAVDDALRSDRLKRQDLAMLQPYQPSLSAAWLFQRSMAMRVGAMKWQTGGKGSRTVGWVPSDHINRLMRCNFSVMKLLGERVLKPFLQDTIRFWPLAKTMIAMSFRDPIVIARVVRMLGPRTLLAWVGHYFALAAYTLLHVVAGRWAAKSKHFRVRRWAEAWRWGSGQDEPEDAAAVRVADAAYTSQPAAAAAA